MVAVMVTMLAVLAMLAMIAMLTIAVIVVIVIDWKLIYRAATKAGLSDAEAQEVVQETVIVVAGKMENFKYDPAKDSFKGWLLYLTRKQIAMQYRKRQRERGGDAPRAEAAAFTADLESIPDPAASDLETMWNEEWARNLMDAAIAKVKRMVNPKQFQMFNFYVLKQWPVQEVAKTLEVSAARVYPAKHRIYLLIKKESKKQEKHGCFGATPTDNGQRTTN